MLHNEYFLNRQVQVALYALQRQYGGTITVFHILSQETNTKTGEPSVRYRATRINRAIILPVRISREVERTISIISANKQLVTGGGYDSGKRTFIINRRDAPTLVLEKDDFFVYKGCKYAFDAIDDYEFASAYSVVAKRLTGETFDDTTLVQHLDADDSVELVGSADQLRVLTGEAGDALNLASDSLAEV
jgi:hypothetical protein